MIDVVSSSLVPQFGSLTFLFIALPAVFRLV